MNLKKSKLTEEEAMARNPTYKPPENPTEADTWVRPDVVMQPRLDSEGNPLPDGKDKINWGKGMTLYHFRCIGFELY